MALTSAQYAQVNGMCPVAKAISLAERMDRVCGTLTIDAADGTGTIAVPQAWGTDYVVVLTILDGPAAVVQTRVTKQVGEASVQVVDSSGTAVDCSSTSAVLDYLIVRVV